MKKKGLVWEMQKLKDEMSDLRAALRQQLNLVADRLASLDNRLASLDSAMRDMRTQTPIERGRRKRR